MNTNLIFFDTTKNSRIGTLKGLVAIFFIYILSFLWYNIILKNYYSLHTDIQNVNMFQKITGIVIILFLLCSAISVQNPSNRNEAIVYGALVGFSMYGFFNAVNLMISPKWNLKISTIDTIWGILSTSFISWMLYEILPFKLT